MKRVLMLVEGQTEERFIKDCLNPTMLDKDICIIPTILTTKRIKDGTTFKGGVLKYAHVKRDLKNLLNDSNACCITTMFDLYGLPDDFPGKKLYTDRKGCEHNIAAIEKAFADDINDDRFYPYIQLHEFEALLFSKPDVLCKIFPHPENAICKFVAIKNSFVSPEEINNGPTTCPSKRIIDVYPDYRKVLHGTIVAKRIGLLTMRSECAHFSEWLEHIESL